jgi:hypothetical protein
MNLLDFEKAKLVGREMEREIKKYRNLFSNRLLSSAYFNIAVLHFICENHDECLKWCKCHFEFEASNIKLNQEVAISIFEIIASYHSYSFEGFEAVLNRNISDLKRKKDANRFAKISISFFTKIPDKHATTEFSALFQDYQQEILSLYKKRGNRYVDGMEEAFYWVTAQINKQSVLHVMCENLKTKKR